MFSLNALSRTSCAAFFFCLSIALAVCAGSTTAQAQTTINFNELPYNTVVSRQYSGVHFYTSSGRNLWANHSWNYSGGGFSDGFLDGGYYPSTDLIVEFSSPVKNLSFRYGRAYENSVGAPVATLDIYEYGNYTRSVYLYPHPQRSAFVNLSGLGDNITKIHVRNLNNFDQPLWFDDFTYTPNVPHRINIHGPRTDGVVNDQTRNALLGAEVELWTWIEPGDRQYGEYSWSIEGPHQTTTGTNQSGLGVRWTQPGNYQVRVNYTYYGTTVSASLRVNVVAPTLTTFTANQMADEINRNRDCSLLSRVGASATYTLGCYQNTDAGIIYTVNARIPNGSYISDLSKSGIKFKQAVSVYRRRINKGNFECFTARSGEYDVQSGWQLDTIDPFFHPEHPPQRFSEGYDLLLTDFDPPGTSLDGVFRNVPFFYDAMYVDDRFEMYAYYFVGDPSNPQFEQPLRLVNSASAIDRIAWRWGGLVHFDSSVGSIKYKRLSSSTTVGGIAATGANMVMPMQTNAASLQWRPCSNTRVTSNPIDDSRTFVARQYQDILLRFSPGIDEVDAWTSVITRCAFDTTCINNMRIATARGFFESPEFRRNKPALSNPGTPEYNREYVRQCYLAFLIREPDQGGWDAWTSYINSSGDYNTLVGGFINSPEYRRRFGEP